MDSRSASPSHAEKDLTSSKLSSDEGTGVRKRDSEKLLQVEVGLPSEKNLYQESCNLVEEKVSEAIKVDNVVEICETLEDLNVSTERLSKREVKSSRQLKVAPDTDNASLERSETSNVAGSSETQSAEQMGVIPKTSKVSLQRSLISKVGVSTKQGLLEHLKNIIRYDPERAALYEMINQNNSIYFMNIGRFYNNVKRCIENPGNLSFDRILLDIASKRSINKELVKTPQEASSKPIEIEASGGFEDKESSDDEIVELEDFLLDFLPTLEVKARKDVKKIRRSLSEYATEIAESKCIQKCDEVTLYLKEIKYSDLKKDMGNGRELRATIKKLLVLVCQIGVDGADNIYVCAKILNLLSENRRKENYSDKHKLIVKSAKSECEKRLEILKTDDLRVWDIKFLLTDLCIVIHHASTIKTWESVLILNLRIVEKHDFGGKSIPPAAIQRIDFLHPGFATDYAAFKKSTECEELPEETEKVQQSESDTNARKSPDTNVQEAQDCQGGARRRKNKNKKKRKRK